MPKMTKVYLVERKLGTGAKQLFITDSKSFAHDNITEIELSELILDIDDKANMHIKLNNRTNKN